jgi:hypothetical protein
MFWSKTRCSAGVDVITIELFPLFSTNIPRSYQVGNLALAISFRNTTEIIVPSEVTALDTQPTRHRCRLGKRLSLPVLQPLTKQLITTV